MPCLHGGAVNAHWFDADAKSRCPQVDLVDIPGADHHVTLDNPGGFVDAVNAWLGCRARGI
jgi:pimeloyl-ACP methyl ester carboxylesterase